MLIAAVAAAILSAQEPTGAAALHACRQPVDLRDAEATEEAAACLVSALYAPGQLERIDVLGDHAPLLFSRAALSSLSAAHERAGGEVAPGLDADPFCGCQDPSGLTLLASATQVSSDGTGTAAIIITFAPFHEDMTTEELEAALAPDVRHGLRLDLVLEADGWRVDDIVHEDGSSFRAALQL